METKEENEKANPIGDWLENQPLAPIDRDALEALQDRAALQPAINLLRGLDPETLQPTKEFIARPLHPKLRLFIAAILEA